LVSKDDAEKAYNILKDGGFISEAEQKKIEKIKEAEKMNTICPYCNSDNIAKKGTPGYILILSIFLLGLPLPFLRTTYYCFNCDKEWKI